MARGVLIAASLLIACHVAAAARATPPDKTLADQKNFFTFGGVGNYAGISPTGIPYGGIGGGVGVGGLVGGQPLTGIGGFMGTGPDGRYTAVVGSIPGGVVTVGGNTGGIGFQPRP